MSEVFYEAYRASLEVVAATKESGKLRGLAESLNITLSLDDVCQGPAAVAQSLNLYDHAVQRKELELASAAEKVIKETLADMKARTPLSYEKIAESLRNSMNSLEEKKKDEEETFTYDLLKRLKL